MSHTGSSHDIENPCVGECETTKDDSADKDKSVRERVLKEVGLTSTTFIGPAFPPKTSTTKSDLEDTLSEFYKELEKIDTPDGTNGNPGRQDAGSALPRKTSASKGTRDVREEKVVNTETDGGYQQSGGQKQLSWPHWYQNEPYYPRRPRPGMDPSSARPAPPQNQWHYPQVPNRPPSPRFHRPPFHRPPPPSAFTNSQNPPPHGNQNWSGSDMTNQHQEESHFQTYASFPPPDVCSHPSQGYYGDSPYPADKDERRNYDAHADHLNPGWSRDRKEEWCQFGEDYDRHQRYDSENEPWDHRCRPPDTHNTDTFRSSSVLILMRGLPGSGKSTLARYIFV